MGLPVYWRNPTTDELVFFRERYLSISKKEDRWDWVGVSCVG